MSRSSILRTEKANAKVMASGSPYDVKNTHAESVQPRERARVSMRGKKKSPIHFSEGSRQIQYYRQRSQRRLRARRRAVSSSEVRRVNIGCSELAVTTLPILGRIGERKTSGSATVALPPWTVTTGSAAGMLKMRSFHLTCVAERRTREKIARFSFLLLHRFLLIFTTHLVVKRLVYEYLGFISYPIRV